MPEYFAHSYEGKPVEEWHLLEDHLLGVAGLAKSFVKESQLRNGTCLKIIC